MLLSLRASISMELRLVCERYSDEQLDGEHGAICDMTPDAQHILSVRAVAEALDVDTSTVTRWCRARKLAGAEQHAGRWRIPMSALDGFIRPATGRPKGRDRRWGWPVRTQPPVHDCTLARKALGQPAAAKQLNHAWQCPSCGAIWQN